MAGAIFCTLAAKLYHCLRTGLGEMYPACIFEDVAVLVTLEVALSYMVIKRPTKWVLRTATFAAALLCAWSVMNAGWLIRTGTQILPTVLLPLFRDPVNALLIVGVNLAKMPVTAVLLLVPSAAALAFFFCVLARPVPPAYNRRRFLARAIVCLLAALSAAVAGGVTKRQGALQAAFDPVCYNAQLRALAMPWTSRRSRIEPPAAGAGRHIPAFDEPAAPAMGEPTGSKPNVVVVVLEGVQRRFTSLGPLGNQSGFLRTIGLDGVEFINTRTTLTHTTKVLFAILTGRYPSLSQDIAEAVPVEKPYAGLATILERLGYRTAFFQSAKGNFECRAGLVWNLGFDKFGSRDELCDPNAFVGYLGCDEFELLGPVSDWITSSKKPFFLAVLGSVTHDPYEVPPWFAEPAREPLDRYKQAIAYTEAFIEALNVELIKTGEAENTILCVIGDHGEAFGEHGLHAHERIAFDEVLRVPWVIRAPLLLEPGVKISAPTTSIDFTPTLLSLMGFDIAGGGFNGIDAMTDVPEDRRVYFFGWLQESPSGYVESGRKYIYYPINRTVFVHDLRRDPREISGTELTEPLTKLVANTLSQLRRRMFIKLERESGTKVLFGRWHCRWNSRVATAKYSPPEAEQ